MHQTLLVSLLFVLSFISCPLAAAGFGSLLPGLSRVHDEKFSKEELTALSLHFELVFAADFARLGGPLRVRFMASIPSFYSLATLKDGIYEVMIMGDNLSKKNLHKDVLRLLVCHELGHFLGGGPRRIELDPEEDQSWNVIEGQSDYFASLHCMKRVLAGGGHEMALMEDAQTYESELSLMKGECEAHHRTAEDQKICLRSSLAALKLVDYFFAKKSEAGDPDVRRADAFRKDETLVAETLISHPALQCRLDTYRAGALCPLPPQPLDASDLSQGTCDTLQYPPETRRPLCWYAPTKSP